MLSHDTRTALLMSPTTLWLPGRFVMRGVDVCLFPPDLAVRFRQTLIANGERHRALSLPTPRHASCRKLTPGAPAGQYDDGAIGANSNSRWARAR